MPLPRDAAEFTQGVLSLQGLDLSLSCPEGFRVTWGPASTPSVAAQPTSTAG